MCKKKSLKVQILRFLSASVKLTKCLMSLMKPQVIFSSKLTSIFSIMMHSSSLLFSSNIIYLGLRQPKNMNNLIFSSVGSKYAEFLMSFFKARVNSSSNFTLFFNVVTHNSSVLFWFKKNTLSTKVAHQCGNFQICHCSH